MDRQQAGIKAPERRSDTVGAPSHHPVFPHVKVNDSLPVSLGPGGLITSTDSSGLEPSHGNLREAETQEEAAPPAQINLDQCHTHCQFSTFLFSFVTFSLKMVILNILSKTRRINKLHFKTIPEAWNWQEATRARTIKKIHLKNWPTRPPIMGWLLLPPHPPVLTLKVLHLQLNWSGSKQP